MLIGYARVSRPDQSPQLQIDPLKAEGYKKVFVEYFSGGRTDRPVLTQAVDFAWKGDSLMDWRLDRLARSVSHLIEIINRLKEK